MYIFLPIILSARCCVVFVFNPVFCITVYISQTCSHLPCSHFEDVPRKLSQRWAQYDNML
jgi:hypothetical protein